MKLFLLIPLECQVPGADPEINPTLESLCLSMTEHALGGTYPQQLGNKQAFDCQTLHKHQLFYTCAPRESYFLIRFYTSQKAMLLQKRPFEQNVYSINIYSARREATVRFLFREKRLLCGGIVYLTDKICISKQIQGFYFILTFTHTLTH